MVSSILSTKISIPEITEQLIIREELVNKLVKSCDLSSHISLICAPAGYGKTTIVLELLAKVRMSKAWLFIDEGDNDPGRFLTYLIAALKKAGIPIGDDVEFLVKDSGFNSINAVMTAIINSVAAFGERIILVLDDYQFIQSQQVNDIIKFLTDYQPSNLHLILLSRQDPQLPLSRLRVKGRITEIRLGDLAFSDSEALVFFYKVMKLEISPEAVNKVFIRTEGWIAGMQLAALMLKSIPSDKIDNDIEKLTGTHSYIIDFLVEEVLQQQTAAIKEFLYKTSILETMNDGICDTLTGRCDSRDILKQLEKMNLFLLPLDTIREWYRYHHLFADSLKTALPKEEERSLYKKAAGWMQENGYTHEAIRYSIKAEDMELAVRLVEGCTFEVFQNAQLETFNKWLSLLPPKLIRDSEILSVRKSIALFITGRVREALEHLRELGDDFETGASAHNKGLILCMKAFISTHTGQDAETIAKEALNLLEPWDPIARTSMLNTLGKAQFAKGHTAQAIETYKCAYETGLKMGYTFVVTLSLINYGICLDAMGERSKALDLYKNYMEGMHKQFGKYIPHIGIIYITMAELFYEENILDKSKYYLNEGIDLCKSIGYNWLVSNTTHANIQFAEGQEKEAIELLEELLSKKTDIPGIELRAIGLLIQMYIRSGRVDGFEAYTSCLDNYLISAGSRDWSDATLILSRIRISQGKYNEALKDLLYLEEILLLNGTNKELITVSILLAGINYKTGAIEKAYFYIKRALELAAGENYIRLFLDELHLINELIRDEKLRGIAANSQFLSELIQQYSMPNVSSILQEKTKNSQLDFGEKLSEREYEILALIGSGMTNGDISGKLFISVNTTQWHISNIYSKLGVKNRTQAILRARELGIL